MTAPAPDSKFKVWPQPRVLPQSGLISDHDCGYASGLSFCSWDLNCCGIASIQGFSGLVPSSEFASLADIVATLYRECYSPGHVIYCLSSQLSHPIHLALKEIGSAQIAGFPNIFHGPERLSLWLVNIRDAVGKYCDIYGEPYLEPSTKPWKPGTYNSPDKYQYLPKRQP